MHFDHPTAFFIAGLLHVLIPTLIWRLLANHPSQATRWWCGGDLLVGLGTLWVSLVQELVPSLVYGAAAAILIFWGQMLKIGVMRGFLSLPHAPWRARAIALLYVGAEILLELMGGESARGLYFLITHGLLYAYVARLAWRVHVVTYMRSVLWIFWSYAAVVLTLLAVPLGTAVGGADFWQAGPVAAMLAFLGVMTAFTNNIAYVGMVLEGSWIGEKLARQTSDKVSAQNVLGRLLWLSEREQLLTNMSRKLRHEINQPLTSLTASVNLMRRAFKAQRWDELDVGGIIERLERSLYLASGVIEQLLPMTKTSQARFTLVDLSMVVDEALSIMQTFESSFWVEWTPQRPGALLVKGSRVELIQLVVNLVRNAIEACAQASSMASVTIRASQDKGTMCLLISDNGPGFQADILPRLGNLIVTTKNQGMGLGLWICQDIVDRHGGHLRFSNQPRGAKVEVLLPLVQRAESR